MEAGDDICNGTCVWRAHARSRGDDCSARRRVRIQGAPALAPAGGTAAGPKLIRDGERWSITGLSPDAADAIEQGRLVAIQRPIPSTLDQRPIAVFRTLGRPYASTVDVAPP
jgi:hypothetical protein